MMRQDRCAPLVGGPTLHLRRRPAPAAAPAASPDGSAPGGQPQPPDESPQLLTGEPLLLVCCATSSAGDPVTQTYVAFRNKSPTGARSVPLPRADMVAEPVVTRADGAGMAAGWRGALRAMTASICACAPASSSDLTQTLVVGPSYLRGEERFHNIVPVIAAIDLLFCILGCFGLDVILEPPRDALPGLSLVFLLCYVCLADLIAIAACARPSMLKCTLSLVLLLPKMFFCVMNASTFFALSVWATTAIVILVVTVRSGISWEIVDIPPQEALQAVAADELAA